MKGDDTVSTNTVQSQRLAPLKHVRLSRDVTVLDKGKDVHVSDELKKETL